MSDKTTDFIFCPLCGSIRWITDKTKSTKIGKLEAHKCCGCKKFTYTNHIIKTSLSSNLKIESYDKTRHSIEALIEPYYISVYYEDKVTNFRSDDKLELILSLGQAVSFNWYKREELVEKIKKYVLFS
jgi:hypothetical protein